METIEQARLLGKAIQESEQYKTYMAAKKAADEDKQLQDDIGAFNLIRMQINEQLQKEEKDSQKVNELNDKMREVYNACMSNASMAAYNDAKQSLDAMVQNAKQIIDMALMGEDPMTCELSSGCSGSCASCGGCH